MKQTKPKKSNNKHPKNTHSDKKYNKVVLKPLVSPDLAIYIFKQLKVKMTLRLRPCHVTLKYVKHEASHSVPMIQV